MQLIKPMLNYFDYKSILTTPLIRHTMNSLYVVFTDWIKLKLEDE